MVQLKQYVEERVSNYWNDLTPIHFYGSYFDSTGLDEWIMVRFSPVLSSTSDSLGECVEEEGLTEIFAYSDDLRRSLELSEMLINIMRDAVKFSVRSDIVMEQGSFDNTKWYVNNRIAVRRLPNTTDIASSYLVDSLGIYLLDNNGARLTSTGSSTACGLFPTNDLYIC